MYILACVYIFSYMCTYIHLSLCCPQLDKTLYPFFTITNFKEGGELRLQKGNLKT